ncbi:hypothetical protein HNQ75_004583 [Rhizobium flavum]|jgi:hypothetical protein|uniref:DUF1236 domain-containing protein n=1 Tax=Pseudorhizobium flavum TaxID=1335061 RepID=A0A7W9Z2Z7_9HYPH|nr:hypothetical protein [Pseudorhizobium flavum]MBB6182594.1 hypothetical protein [Pseudorhizobium flavum]CAD6630338.1 membrane protein [Pseudorhizobium flavum]
MKKAFALALVTAVVGASSAFAIEPIPGSITYNGQPSTRLEKAPIGSTVSHEFYADGQRYDELYVIDPDRSLRLVSRSVSSDS